MIEMGFINFAPARLKTALVVEVIFFRFFPCPRGLIRYSHPGRYGREFVIFHASAQPAFHPPL